MATESEGGAKKDKLQARRESYRTGLPQRLAAILKCWQAVRDGDPDAASRLELNRLVHSIAGSSGSFGFAALGEQARELERVLVASSGAPSAELVAEIEKRLAALLALSATPDAAMLSAAAMPGVAESRGEENHRLFVIEDDELLAQEIAGQLDRFGWQVQVFHNASDARAALHNATAPPAAMLVDIVLPEGNLAGTELMRQSREIGRAAIPQIVISARWDWESRLGAARAGAAAYLAKPIDFGILAQKLDQVTRRLVIREHRVLIVDDTAVLAAHYADVLSGAGMDARFVAEPVRLLDVLAEFDPDLILMDIYMPDCNGIEAARVIRQDPKFASVPIVFLSSESDREMQLEAMRTGADDFLQKPIRDAELVAAVNLRAERFREIAGLIRQDSLTGLLNHIAFKLRLEAEIERSRRAGSTLTLAMIDVDRFKRVNDTYGHPTGDHVIRALSELLRRRMRRSDILGRYGGDELTVLMPDTEMAAAVKVIDALRASFEAIRYVGADETFSCSFSAGLAATPPSAGVGDLISGADAALYEAKRAGRNRVHPA